MRFLDYLKRFTYTPNEFYDHLKGVEDAANGNVDICVLPGMTGAGKDGPALEPTVSEANDDYIAEVIVKVVNSAGDTLRFYNGTLEVKAIINTTAGTIAINDGDQGAANADATANLSFENGILAFTVTLGGTWAEDETVKITIDDNDVGIMGYSVEKNNHFLIDVDADPVG